MPLLTLRNIQLSYGAAPLLDGVNLSIEPGERLCLVGRNGAGKSTLMKLIAGEIQADDGDLEKQPGLTIARLVQEVPPDTEGSVFDIVARGLGDLGAVLAEHAALSLTLGDASDAAMNRFEFLQHELDSRDGWTLSQRVETVLTRLALDGGTDFAGLSGGMKRRVLLAQSLVQEPDILLLDEPTNHLDIESIRWLEEFMKGWNGTLLFITHDRAFLRALATRIIELDRGKLTSWPGSYEKYLEGKQAQLDAEEKANSDFDKKLSQEERWIRQGIKARRTRNEGRVRALKAMRQERASRRERTGQASMTVQQGDKSGKLVIEAQHLTASFAGQTLFRDFSITVQRGDRIGLIGPNGCGKSTLLKLLLGRMEPQQGTVKLGTNLQIAWFDQLRETLDENKSIIENVVEGSDFIEVNGQSKHIIGYLQDFLFEPARCRQPVKALSGGERNRLLLARLFTRPFNLLVLDEPTNDLDADTLDLLEEQLMQYQGTLLLVSHDREFVDNVVTSTLVFENGEVNEYVGGYQDWLRQRSQPVKQTDKKVAVKLAPASPTAASAKKKLSYKEQQELKELPGRIEALEKDIAALQAKMSDPTFFKNDSATVASTTSALAEKEQALELVFNRWSELEP
ncbi:MAG: ATP-binding cassette domain-containing protein [Alcanivoracaceae bacterium]|jgi:ATP-binding cassette subfamily F protein uup|nr:ATP-binding cassette domain-containing protein [Alcanivoracaceae bacterium]